MGAMCRFVVLDMPNLAGLPMLSPPYRSQDASNSGKVITNLIVLCMQQR